MLITTSILQVFLVRLFESETLSSTRTRLSCINDQFQYRLHSFRYPASSSS
ncbi:hypothetical protein M758_9G112700 [Ceratodon purpureus]|nr:hypothetical protein M758_9G112700 [Ceratodon purpureus]